MLVDTRCDTFCSNRSRNWSLIGWNILTANQKLQFQGFVSLHYLTKWIIQSEQKMVSEVVCIFYWSQYAFGKMCNLISNNFTLNQFKPLAQFICTFVLQFPRSCWAHRMTWRQWQGWDWPDKNSLARYWKWRRLCALDQWPSKWSGRGAPRSPESSTEKPWDRL